MALTIFVLSSGRSGTRHLTELFRNNATDFVCKHEPLPDMFGRPVYWRSHGNQNAIRRSFRVKRARILRARPRHYLETSHAFLKSFSEVALEAFPDLSLIQLIRNPIEVARSELNRHLWLDKIHFPRRYRSVDSRRYFRWSLTDDDPIYESSSLPSITPFQHYALQWIEIENRAMAFVRRHDLHRRCFTMHIPVDFTEAKMEHMFRFFDIGRRPAIRMKGRQHRNPMPTVVTERDRNEFAAAMKSLPAHYFEVFRHPPYSDLPWRDLLIP